MSIIFIGYRGSGKSTVGRIVAARLQRPFVDVDELIIRKAGKSIKEIFEQDGEPAFRDIESAVLEEACQLKDHVIALGGGALNRPQNRAVVKAGKHTVVYLRADPAELVKRIQADTATAENRPNLTHLGGGVEEVTSLLAIREPIYREAMTFDVDVTELSAEEVAKLIEKRLVPSPGVPGEGAGN